MVFKREWLRNAKALLIWSLVLGAMVVLTLSIFSSMAGEQESMEELMKAYPESLQKVFGMDRLDFSSLIGFYGIEVHFMTTLFGSIYAVMLGSGMIAKEENDKTIEFLLSKPITRTRIVGEKLSAVFVNVTIFNAALLAAGLIGAQLAGDAELPMRPFFMMVTGTLLLHLMFASIALAFSAAIRKTRSVLAISLAVVFISYFLNTMAGLSEQADALKYVSPFRYVDAADIVSHDGLSPLYVAIMLLVLGACSAIAFVIYRRKDISV